MGTFIFLLISDTYTTPAALVGKVEVLVVAGGGAGTGGGNGGGDWSFSGRRHEDYRW